MTMTAISLNRHTIKYSYLYVIICYFYRNFSIIAIIVVDGRVDLIILV